MVAILMMSGKLATLGLLKIKLFQNKGYDIIISCSCQNGCKYKVYTNRIVLTVTNR